MNRVVELVAYGRPVTQGSKNAFARGGRVVLVESSKNWRAWRNTVAAAAREAASAGGRFEGPVAVDIRFEFARPRSHYGTGRNAGRVRPSAPGWPATKATGDGDKLQRAVFDALTVGGLIEDDARVVDGGWRKVWCPPGGRECARVTVVSM